MTKEFNELLKTYEERAKEIKTRFTTYGKTDKQFYNEIRDYENFKDLMPASNFKEILKFKKNRKDRRSVTLDPKNHTRAENARRKKKKCC